MEYNTSGIRTKRTSDDKTYRYIRKAQAELRRALL